MYEAVEDPYCYLGSSVLRNLPDLRSQAELDAMIRSFRDDAQDLAREIRTLVG